jgi:hypothetical protein
VNEKDVRFGSNGQRPVEQTRATGLQQPKDMLLRRRAPWLVPLSGSAPGVPAPITRPWVPWSGLAEPHDRRIGARCQSHGAKGADERNAQKRIGGREGRPRRDERAPRNTRHTEEQDRENEPDERAGKNKGEHRAKVDRECPGVGRLPGELHVGPCEVATEERTIGPLQGEKAEHEGRRKRLRGGGGP